MVTPPQLSTGQSGTMSTKLQKVMQAPRSKWERKIVNFQEAQSGAFWWQDEGASAEGVQPGNSDSVGAALHNDQGSLGEGAPTEADEGQLAATSTPKIDQALQKYMKRVH